MGNRDMEMDDSHLTSYQRLLIDIAESYFEADMQLSVDLRAKLEAEGFDVWALEEAYFNNFNNDYELDGDDDGE